MKTKTLGMFLFLLFVVSSLEAVWADDVTDIEEFHEFDSSDNSLNAFDDAFDAIDNELNEIEENAVRKRKHACLVKSTRHAKGQCSKSSCKKSCKEDGYKNGKCKKSPKNVRECYCQIQCKKHHHHADPPSHPPSHSPVRPLEVSSDEEVVPLTNSYSVEGSFDEAETVPSTNSYGAYNAEEDDVVFP